MSHGHGGHRAPRAPQPVAGALQPSDTFRVKLAQWMLPVRVLRHDATRTTLTVRLPVQSPTNGAHQDILINKPLDQVSVGAAIMRVREWMRYYGADVVVPCVNPGCGGPSWNRNHFPLGYHDGRCADCFTKGWSNRVDELQQDRLTKNRVEDDAAKRLGFTHKSTAWVHPPAGDAYQLIWHTNGPMLETAIKAVLRHEGSTDMTDFTIKELG